MTSLRDGLRCAYECAVYVAELPAGKVEFRLEHAPYGPAPDTPLAIVTAWNPGILRPSGAVNKAANRQLEAALKESGRKYFPACGHSQDKSYMEPSFAVSGITPRAAVGLGRAFGQAAVFYWDGSNARLLWCNEP